MTDKQIIERLKTNLDFERTKRKSLQADLKAKDQECEELKKQVQDYKGLITSTGKINYQLIQEYDKLKNCN